MTDQEEDMCFEDYVSSARQSGLGDQNSTMITGDCDQGPLITEAPCDIALLRIIPAGDGRRAVIAEGPSERDRALSARDRRRLRGYDVLYECIGEPEDAPTADPAKADLTIGIVCDATCSNHPQMSFRVDGAPTVGRTKTLNIAPPAIYSRERPRSGTIASWLGGFWDFNIPPRNCIVAAETCGIPSGPHPAVSHLTGLVRVHRKLECRLTISIPPLGRVTRDEEARISYTGRLTRQRQRNRARRGDSESTSNTEIRDDRRGEAIRRESTTEVEDGTTFTYGQTLDDSTDETIYRDSESSLRQPIAPGVSRRDSSDRLTGDTGIHIENGISFTVNDETVPLADALNSILNIATSIRRFFDSVEKFVPELGWTFHMDIAVLEGNVSAAWGRRVRPVTGNGRVARVSPYYEFRVQTDLVRFVATLKFGIDVNFVAVSGTAQIRGSVEARCPVSGTVRFGDGTDGIVEAEPRIEAKLVGEMKACLVGFCAGYKVDVAMSFTLTARFQVSTQEDPSFSGLLKLDRGDVVINERNGTGGYHRVGSMNLFPEIEIWEAKVPN